MKTQQHRGFTLIELLVGCFSLAVIVVILAAIIGVGVLGYNHYQIQQQQLAPAAKTLSAQPTPAKTGQ